MRLPLLMSLIFVINLNFYKKICQISFFTFILLTIMNIQNMNANDMDMSMSTAKSSAYELRPNTSLLVLNEFEALTSDSDLELDLDSTTELDFNVDMNSENLPISAELESRAFAKQMANRTRALGTIQMPMMDLSTEPMATKTTYIGFKEEFKDSSGSTAGSEKIPSEVSNYSNQIISMNRTKEYSSLSSLSLLSANETIPPIASLSSAITTASGGMATNSKHPRANQEKPHIHSNATNGSFQQIGMQKLQLKTTMPTSLFNPNANSNPNTNSSDDTSTTNSTNSNNKPVIRTSARKVETKFILPKAQKTDAPMLNYIFDTYSSANKHHHHDQRYGPHFEDVQRVGQPTNLTVQAGSSIHLNCKISLLQDKTVSWVRRNTQGENALDLLTVGKNTYTGDKRYQIEFQYPNNWRLKITNVKKDDEAVYECQISTHPPRVIQINLHVNAPKVMIIDEVGDPLQEKYYEIDSTLQLSCVVRNVAMSSSVVFWKHAEDVLNYDVTRGGVSVKTELMDDGANSTLFIAKINKSDSGNYTCSINEYQNFTVVVHILNGESFAELHHGSAGTPHFKLVHQQFFLNVLIFALILCLPPIFVTR